jgi:hypothetical protein
LNKQEFPANISDSAAKYERDFDWNAEKSDKVESGNVKF